MGERVTKARSFASGSWASYWTCVRPRATYREGSRAEEGDALEVNGNMCCVGSCAGSEEKEREDEKRLRVVLLCCVAVLVGKRTERRVQDKASASRFTSVLSSSHLDYIPTHTQTHHVVVVVHTQRYRRVSPQGRDRSKEGKARRNA